MPAFQHLHVVELGPSHVSCLMRRTALGFGHDLVEGRIIEDLPPQVWPLPMSLIGQPAGGELLTAWSLCTQAMKIW